MDSEKDTAQQNKAIKLTSVNQAVVQAHFDLASVTALSA